MTLLAGQVVHQFTAAPVGGVKVAFQNQTAQTDADGRFTIAGNPVTSRVALTLTKTGMVTRKTYARSSDSRWGMVPSAFDMSAFNDVSRQRSASGTVRWASKPKLIIDTRMHGFTIAQSTLDQWVAEVKEQGPAFIRSWTGNKYDPEVVVTKSPPSDFTAGTLISKFSERDSDYGGGPYIGYARISWGKNGVIQSATVCGRFKKYATSPGKRKGILGHELGHALGYAHMDRSSPASFMQPSLGSKVDLKDFDRLIAGFTYDRSPLNTAPDTDKTTTYALRKTDGVFRWEGPCMVEEFGCSA